MLGRYFLREKTAAPVFKKVTGPSLKQEVADAFTEDAANAARRAGKLHAAENFIADATKRKAGDKLRNRSLAGFAGFAASFGAASLAAKRYSDKSRLTNKQAEVNMSINVMSHGFLSGMQNTANEKRAAIPAARIAELRGKLAPRLREKLQTASENVVKHAPGPARERARAFKNRLAVMTSKSEHHDMRQYMKRVGAEPVPVAVARLRAEQAKRIADKDPFGGARSASAPVKTPSPMSGDKTVVTAKPAAPPADLDKTNPGFKRPSPPSADPDKTNPGFKRPSSGGTFSGIFSRKAAA